MVIHFQRTPIKVGIVFAEVRNGVRVDRPCETVNVNCFHAAKVQFFYRICKRCDYFYIISAIKIEEFSLMFEKCTIFACENILLVQRLAFEDIIYTHFTSMTDGI